MYDFTAVILFVHRMMMFATLQKAFVKIPNRDLEKLANHCTQGDQNPWSE